MKKGLNCSMARIVVTARPTSCHRFCTSIIISRSSPIASRAARATATSVARSTLPNMPGLSSILMALKPRDAAWPTRSLTCSRVSPAESTVA